MKSCLLTVDLCCLRCRCLGCKRDDGEADTEAEDGNLIYRTSSLEPTPTDAHSRRHRAADTCMQRCPPGAGMHGRAGFRAQPFLLPKRLLAERARERRVTSKTLTRMPPSLAYRLGARRRCFNGEMMATTGKKMKCKEGNQLTRATSAPAMAARCWLLSASTASCSRANRLGRSHLPLPVACGPASIFPEAEKRVFTCASTRANASPQQHAAAASTPTAARLQQQQRRSIMSRRISLFWRRCWRRSLPQQKRAR